MLKRLGQQTPAVPIVSARFPAPFVSGLEYSAPARGTWNIVHLGMLVPEAHLIFVCAQGCLRGVVLTAAEMGASDRFSTIAVREENVLYGDMEELIIEGVTDILDKLPKKPPAVLVYTSCVHHFMGSDLALAYRVLNERHPGIHFTDCYMNPIMRKSGLTPDQLMRRQLYSLLEPRPRNPKAIAILGNAFAMDKTSELCTLLTTNGYLIREINTCNTYEEYQQLAECAVCITTFPAALPAGELFAEKLNQTHLYLPFSFDPIEIRQNMKKLADELAIDLPDYSSPLKKVEQVLVETRNLIGETPIAVDYTAFHRPLGLVRLLLNYGFHVTRLYADNFSTEEQSAFQELQQLAPNLLIYPTVHASMRVEKRASQEKTLAIGQKAAYFCGTDYFVDIAEGSGLYGFDGIIQLASLLQEAFLQSKDAQSRIQIKGWGCGSCL